MDKKEEQKTPVNPTAEDTADTKINETTSETPANATDAPKAEEAAAKDDAPTAKEQSPKEAETEEGQSTKDEDKAEEPKTEEAPAVPDWKDRYARAMADFDNFRKRTARDREDLVKSAAADVIKEILPTVDNLALALEKAKDKADDPFVAGVKLVYDGLLKSLANQGATPLDSVGEPFDANFHEALAQLPSPEVEEGVIMNEVKRGWLLNGKLLRAAQVVVSSGKPA